MAAQGETTEASAFQAGAALAIFLASCAGVIALALRPQSVPLVPAALWRRRLAPASSSRRPPPPPHLPLTYAFPPVAGTLLMLATTALSPQGCWRGVAGDAQIQPYAIVVVFLGLAYLAAALDSTGALACAALSAALKSKGRGRPLYLVFFGLSSVLTACTSNDVCVMALTPLILYTCAASGRADPSLYLFGMFAASNLASIALMFGNPTNLIVAVASQMTFLSYARAMALPALAAVLAAFFWMYVVQGHRSLLPESVAVPTALNPRSLLSDPWGAAWSALCLLLCLAALAAAPSVGWPLWPPVLACCGLQLAFSVAVYGYGGKGGGWGGEFVFERERAEEEEAAAAGGEATATIELSSAAAATAAAAAPPASATSVHAAPSMSSLPLLPAAASEPSDPEAPPQPASLRLRRRSREEGPAPPLPPPPPAAVVAIVAAAAAPATPPPSSPPLVAPQPTVLGPIAALPFHIVPFTLGMFCLVEGLQETGTTAVLGRALGRATAGGNPYLSALVVGLLATVACNAINNQPMTVLFTRALLSPGGFAAGVGAVGGGADAALRAALFATVIASNVGANFTLVGALAGVMFADIVKRKEREAGLVVGGGGGGGSAGKGGGAGAGASAAAAAPAAPQTDVSYWGFFRTLAPGGAASLFAALGVMMAQMAASGGQL